MTWLRDRAVVSGIGETAYVRGSGKSALSLQLEAPFKAIEDVTLELTLSIFRAA